ncbi:MAG: class II fructose-bisphosphate aldolase [Sphaerochaetaceae bacterium]
MSLITLRSVMMKAQREGYAVGSFNFYGLENVQGIIAGAAAKNAPVIVQASAGCVKHMGEKGIVGMVKGISDDYGIPVVLHLDHATDYDTICRCIDNGFTSVMIDASTKSFNENIDITSKVVEYAAKSGVSVEAELGHIGGNEDGVTLGDREALFTIPETALEFVNKTGGIDALAIAVGTAHGFYKLPPKLDFERISIIHSLIPNMPLVLHGGTGVPDEDFKESIKRGISKINIGTELWINGYGNIMKKYSEEMPWGGDPRAVMAKVREACKKIVEHKIDVFGSTNKNNE